MVDSKSVKSSGMSVASADGKKRKSLGAKVKGMVKGIRKSTRKMKRSGSRNSLTNPSVASASKSVVQIEIEKEQYAVKDSSKKLAKEAVKKTKAAAVTTTPEKKAAAAAAAVDSKTFESLQLVLLLMDPTSRRFELLQLEFDSERARVADIIAQIPISVTETDIRQQSYKHVLDETATLRDQATRLIEFCNGKHVLVAVPEGTPVKDCVRLARPILSDPQVVKMLNMSGFNVDKWNQSTQAEEAEVKSRGGPVVGDDASKSASQDKASKKSAKVFAPIIPIIAFLILVLQTYHNIVTTPIQVGIPLGPGTYRYKCGLLSFSPFHDCTDAHLEVNDDGTVAVFNDSNELDMLLVGGICTPDESNCVDGILLEEDGKVYVGGRLVKSIARFDDSTGLSPWPFAEEPKLKSSPFSKNTNRVFN